MFKKIGDYQLKQEIGFGTFSRVYFSEDSQGKNFAVKMINKENLSQLNIEGIEKEVEILLKLNHPNIIKLHDLKKTGNNWYLMFDYCQHGDLSKFMKNYMKNGIPEIITQKIIQQLVNAMQELRKFNIVHRDLKLGNILIEKEFNIKLADFGFARFQGEQDIMVSFCGTPITMAPEILKRQNYNEKCDIWSLGIIIYQLLFGRPPFMPTNKNQNMSESLLEAIETQKIDYKTIKIQSKQCIDLLQKMLIIDPIKRITFEEIFEHPWIKEKQSQKNQEIIIQIFDEIMETVQKNKQRKSKIIDPKESVILDDQNYNHSNSQQEEEDTDNLNQNYIQQLQPQYINNFIAMRSFELIHSNTDQQNIKHIENILDNIQQVNSYIEQNQITKEYIPKILYLTYMSIQSELQQIYKNDIQIYFGQARILDLPLPEITKNQITNLMFKVNNYQKQISQQYKLDLQDLVQSKAYSTLTALSKFVIQLSNIIIQDDFEKNNPVKFLLQIQQFLKNTCLVITQGQFLQEFHIIFHNNLNNQNLKDKFTGQISEQDVKKIFIQQNQINQETNQIYTIEKMEIVKAQFQCQRKLNQSKFNDESKKVYLDKNLDLIFKIINDKIEYYEELLLENQI